MKLDRAIVTKRLVDDLTYAYRGVYEPEVIDRAVTDAWDLLAAQSTIDTFLPILVARQATEQLMAAAQAQRRMAKKVPELLFVCVQNAGRSQMAAALAEHLSAQRVHVRSAGSAPTGRIHPVVIEALQERGIALGTAYPKPLSDSVVRAADVIVTMGCGDTCPIFPGKRYVDWDVADPADQPIDVVRDIRDDLQTRVTRLLRPDTRVRKRKATPAWRCPTARPSRSCESATPDVPRWEPPGVVAVRPIRDEVKARVLALLSDA